MFCCWEVNCVFCVRDLKCKEKNVFCCIVREKVMLKLNIVKKEILKLFNELWEVKKVFNVV